MHAVSAAALIKTLTHVPATSRVGRAGIFEHDAAVLEALDLAWRMPSDELIACEIGVRNRQGEVYRRAALTGVAQMLLFEERMDALGFSPELEDSEQEGSGFDAVFRYRRCAGSASA
ncbi:MAG: hypothetical protein JWQ72_1332 [Polaromonas sp.]|nr:hypothetical protein [Polaromonas sp.]